MPSPRLHALVAPLARNAARRCLGLSFTLVSFFSLLTGCSGVQVINALSSTSGYTVTSDVAYGEGDRRKLDVYRPASLAAGATAPVVVFIYGGSWRDGSKAEYRFAAEALTAHGIVTVIADYRVFPEVSYPSFIDDTAGAVAWTYRHIAGYGGDPQRIFITGHSAGAYNAAMVAYDPRWLKAYGLSPEQFRGFVGLAGPYNFLPIVDNGVKEVFHWPGTPPDSQPINHVTGRSMPALLLAARKDSFVYPEKNTEPFAAKLKADGVDVTVHVFDRVNHVTLMGAMAWPLRFLAPVEKDFTDFVLSH